MHQRIQLQTVLRGVLLAALAGMIAQTPARTGAQAQGGELPPNRAEFGLIYDGLLPRAIVGPCGNRFVLPDGSCTHGPDPVPPGLDIAADIPALPAERQINEVICDGDGVAGKRVQVMYVRAADAADRYAQYAASIRTWASQMDDLFYLSAQETGGSMRVRFVTGAGCTLQVLNVVVPANGDDTFSASISALRTLGHSRSDRKYLMFFDARIYCGIAQFANDDRAGAVNLHNSGPMYGRVDAGCWGAKTAAHELMHTLGAVQDSAPNTTNNLGGSTGGHCTDEYDIMCYSDAGGGQPPMRNICPQAHDNRFDCNNDDYFHSNPPAGSYLATRWNAAKNAFLIQTSATVAPLATATATATRPPATATPGPSPTPLPTIDPLTLTQKVYVPLARKR